MKNIQELKVMNLNELKSEFNISEEVYKLLKNIEVKFKKPIIFKTVTGVPVDATTKIAREKMDRHIIKINTNALDYIEYLLAHECGHIIRTMEAHSKDRVNLALNPIQYSMFCEKVERRIRGVVGATVSMKHAQFLTENVVLMMFNSPVDSRIERWIHEEFPGLRDSQKKYLDHYVSKILSSVGKNIERHSSSYIYEPVTAANYAYLKSLSHIIGEDKIKPFLKNKPLLKLGEELYKYIEVVDEGYVQDMTTVKKWGKILKIDELMAWRNFEDIPMSYAE